MVTPAAALDFGGRPELARAARTLVSPQHGKSRSHHADPQGDGSGMSLCSSSSRSRSRAAMNRECRPSYSSSTALALAVSWPKRRRVCMSSRCVRRNVSDRATRSSARASSLGRSRGIGDTVPRAGDFGCRTFPRCRCRNLPFCIGLPARAGQRNLGAV